MYHRFLPMIVDHVRASPFAKIVFTVGSLAGVVVPIDGLANFQDLLFMRGEHARANGPELAVK